MKTLRLDSRTCGTLGVLGLLAVGTALLVPGRPAVTAALVFLLFLLVVLVPTLVRGIPHERAIRPTLFVASYFIPLFFGQLLLPAHLPDLAWVWAATAAAAALPLCTRLLDLRVSLDRELMPLLPPVTGADLAVRAWYALGGALGEEVFYRGYLFPTLLSLIGPLSHIVTTLVFLLMHWFGVFHKEYSRRDYLSIALLSTFANILVLYSGSLLPALVAHALFNIPAVLHFVLRYRYGAPPQAMAMGRK